MASQSRVTNPKARTKTGWRARGKYGLKKGKKNNKRKK